MKLLITASILLSMTYLTEETPKKPTFTYYGATWCGPCRKMKKGVLNHPEVKAELKKWDVEILEHTKKEDRPKFSKERIDYLPTIVIMKGDRAERMTGYRSKDALLKRLRLE